MTTNVDPFALLLGLESGALTPHTTRIERRVSNLVSLFEDSEDARAQVEAGDPIVYEVLQYDVPEETGHLICCTTKIAAGLVGDEYYMTKGHYHSDRATGEVYLGLSGSGYLLLMTEQGASQAIPMERGIAAYVPPFWAHRTVNTGDEPFVFFAVYPGQAGHDYASIEQDGFKQRVRRTGHGTVVS